MRARRNILSERFTTALILPGPCELLVAPLEVRLSVTPPADASTLLRVDGLRTEFSTDQGPVTSVDGVSFSLAAGETLCLVGESGSGKSVSALSIMGLLATNGRITAGSVMFEGQDLVGLPDQELRRIRGHAIAMIFQEPMTSLNPVLTIGDQLAET